MQKFGGQGYPAYDTVWRTQDKKLYLKESKFRYNTKNSGENLYKVLLKLVR